MSTTQNENDSNTYEAVNDQEAGLEVELPNFPSPLTLEQLAESLKYNKKKRIIVVSGAGVSCAAGIPDFRSPGTGLYHNLQRYNLPFPEAIFDLEFFRGNPDPFVTLASEIYPDGSKYTPTITHCFIRLLQEKGLLLRNYTQNIDGLEILVGLEEDKVVECHGHFRSAKCIDCNIPYSGDFCKNAMLNEGIVPRCQLCLAKMGQPKHDRQEEATSLHVDELLPSEQEEHFTKKVGLIKPDIVFFGESLPQRVKDLIRKDISVCDMMIVMGTSLTVYPVALLPMLVDHDVPRLLVNRDLVGDFRKVIESTFDPLPGLAHFDDEEKAFSWIRDKYRSLNDVFEQGECDERVNRLCKLVGWKEDLEAIYSEVRKQYTVKSTSKDCIQDKVVQVRDEGRECQPSPVKKQRIEEEQAINGNYVDDEAVVLKEVERQNKNNHVQTPVNVHFC